jgi:hypothetical protein
MNWNTKRTHDDHEAQQSDDIVRAETSGSVDVSSGGAARPSDETFASRKAGAEARNTAKANRVRLLSLGEQTVWAESGGRDSHPIEITFETLIDNDRNKVYRRYREDPNRLIEVSKGGMGREDTVRKLPPITHVRVPSQHAPAAPDRVQRLGGVDW